MLAVLLLSLCWSFLHGVVPPPSLPRDTNGDADQNNDAAGGDAGDGDVDGDTGLGDTDLDEANGRCNEKYILPPHHDNIVCDDLWGGTFGLPEYDEGAIQKM